MKKLLSLLIALAIVNLMFISCEKQEDAGTPPELPPLESMKIDFSKFTVEEKSAIETKSTESDTKANYGWASANVFIFNTILAVTLVVPIAAFATSFNQEAEFLGDATWQWKYTVEGFSGNYHARLTGQVRDNDVKWEMYISREGVGAFDEFLWYEGTSALDGNSGEWLLYHSADFQEPLLQIDWEKTGEEMGEVQYTVVRELTDDRSDNPNYGSYIKAGKTDNEYNAYYTIYQADSERNVFIEWNTTTFYGRVMDEKWYHDTEWHCWDNQGFDIDCTE
jgi:hypothetical protein